MLRRGSGAEDQPTTTVLADLAIQFRVKVNRQLRLGGGGWLEAGEAARAAPLVMRQQGWQARLLRRQEAPGSPRPGTAVRRRRRLKAAPVRATIADGEAGHSGGALVEGLGRCETESRCDSQPGVSRTGVEMVDGLETGGGANHRNEARWRKETASLPSPLRVMAVVACHPCLPLGLWPFCLFLFW